MTLPDDGERRTVTDSLESPLTEKSSVGEEFRLHPWSILLNLRGELKGLIVPAIFVLIAGRKSERGFFVQLTGFLIIGFVGAIWRYLSQRMRFDETEFVIKTGIIKRNERRIPYSRIQSVDSTRNAIQQLLGVAEIVIHTAGSAEPEAKLTVLKASAVADFRRRIFASAAVAPDAMATEGASSPVFAGENASAEAIRQREVVLRLSTRDLLLYGFIENRGMLLILGAIGVLFEYGPIEKLLDDTVKAEFDGQGPLRAFFTGLFSPEGLTPQLLLYAAAALALLLLFVRLMSVVWAVVRLHDFTVFRDGAELRVEYGLATRVAGTIPLARVQTVSTDAGIVHRLFDCVTLDVTVAQGGNLEKGGLREPLAPILPRSRVGALIRELMPDLAVDAAAWEPLHERAHVRLFRSGIVSALLLTALLFPVLRLWAGIVFALALLWKGMTSKRVAHSINWTLSEQLFAVRHGWIGRHELVARMQKMQVLALRRTYFDRRTAMAGIRAHTAGGVAQISYLPVQVAERVLRQLSVQAARTKFRL